LEQKSERVPLKVKPAGIAVDLGVPRLVALPVNATNHSTPAPPLRQEKSGPFATVPAIHAMVESALVSWRHRF